jgi:hypothetical protein
MWVLRPYLIVAVALLMITAVELSNRRPLSERRRYPPATAVARPARATPPPATDQGGVP